MTQREQKLDALLCKMQADMIAYLIPSQTCNKDWFINRIILHLDGPDQRYAQSAQPVQPATQAERERCAALDTTLAADAATDYANGHPVDFRKYVGDTIREGDEPLQSLKEQPNELTNLIDACVFEGGMQRQYDDVQKYVDALLVVKNAEIAELKSELARPESTEVSLMRSVHAAEIAALREDALMAATVAFCASANQFPDELPHDAQDIAIWIEANTLSLLSDSGSGMDPVLAFIRKAMAQAVQHDHQQETSAHAGFGPIQGDSTTRVQPT